MLSGWDLFKIHHSLKLHFTTKAYDVLKYNGKSRIQRSAFDNRRDKMRFDGFANKLFNKNKAGHFCIANFVKGDPNFIYGTFDDAYDVYLEWRKVRESQTRLFQLDVQYLNQLQSNKPDHDFFDKTIKGNLPPLLQVAMVNKVNIETVCILDKEHKQFFDKWDGLCNNDPYASNIVLKMKKYQPFVSYDSDKIQKVLEGATF